MPTIISHTALPLAVGVGLGPKTIPRPLLVAGVVASILPDLDVAAFRFGIPYTDQFGHRGFSHSLFCAAILALLGVWVLRRYRIPAGIAFTFLFVAAASHGLLDTITTGGLGIALLWPYSTQRFFAPIQVIKVSPFGVTPLFSKWGVAVLLSELRWIWFPAGAIAISLASLRWWRRSAPSPEANSSV
jgi:inner membrane protein